MLLIVCISNRTIICYADSISFIYFLFNWLIFAITDFRIRFNRRICSETCKTIVRIWCTYKWDCAILIAWRFFIVESFSNIKNICKVKCLPNYPPLTNLLMFKLLYFILFFKVARVVPSISVSICFINEDINWKSIFPCESTGK